MSARDTLRREGRVWIFGDQINTDLIMPSAAFRLPQAEQHKFAFETIKPGWVAAVREGDIIIGGENYGMGSSRPVGAVMKACGVRAVLAESVNGLCLRNCVGVGLPAAGAPGISALFSEGDIARIDYLAGTVENVTSGKSLSFRPMEPLLADIVLAGGVIPMLVSEGYIEPEPQKARTV